MRITRGNAGWVQRYRNGTIVTPTLSSPPIGVIEKDMRDLFFHSYTPTPGDTIVELGAEYGTETLFLSRVVGRTGRVLAVEPHPATFAGLAEMVRLNDLTNVTLVQAAISDVTGMTTITDGAAVSNTTGQGDIKVPSITLADLLREANLSSVDLLKVNIEGAEGPLFGSLTMDDVREIRHMVISCHDFRADSGHGEFYRTGPAVDNALQRLGYNWIVRATDPRPWVRHYRYAAPARP
ncbi:FkbM family methyltransferase [Nocardioides albidus]|uniref:FkbM family methyltransferase n=1 Tax=Nocardioides albidus TaxID=1517589 RepID=UPI0013051631|nr:FkbM family methyltransferase [Nocardioides albidus]